MTRLVRALPQPDLVVLLTAAPAEMVARKREINEAETQRQLSAFRALKLGRPIRVVSTAGTVNDAEARVCAELGRFLEERHGAKMCS